MLERIFQIEWFLLKYGPKRHKSDFHSQSKSIKTSRKKISRQRITLTIRIIAKEHVSPLKSKRNFPVVVDFKFVIWVFYFRFAVCLHFNALVKHHLKEETKKKFQGLSTFLFRIN